MLIHLLALGVRARAQVGCCQVRDWHLYRSLGIGLVAPAYHVTC